MARQVFFALLCTVLITQEWQTVASTNITNTSNVTSTIINTRSPSTNPISTQQQSNHRPATSIVVTDTDNVTAVIYANGCPINFSMSSNSSLYMCAPLKYPNMTGYQSLLTTIEYSYPNEYALYSGRNGPEIYLQQQFQNTGELVNATVGYARWCGLPTVPPPASLLSSYIYQKGHVSPPICMAIGTSTIALTTNTTTYYDAGTSLVNITSMNASGYVITPYNMTTYDSNSSVTYNYQLLRSVFYPLVDQFTMLQLENTVFGNTPTLYNWMWDTSTYMVFEMYNLTSTAVRRFSGGPGITPIIVPFWSIVITLNHGNVTSLDWDTGCSLCSNEYCVDGFCGNDITECSSLTNPNGTINCDFKVYVSWSGTDANGNFLTSSSMRLSNFREWSFNAVYNTATNWLPNALPNVEPATQPGLG